MLFPGIFNFTVGILLYQFLRVIPEILVSQISEPRIVSVATSISASRHQISAAGITHSESFSHMSVFLLHWIQSLPFVVVEVVVVVDVEVVEVVVVDVVELVVVSSASHV